MGTCHLPREWPVKEFSRSTIFVHAKKLKHRSQNIFVNTESLLAIERPKIDANDLKSTQNMMKYVKNLIFCTELFFTLKAPPF